MAAPRAVQFIALRNLSRGSQQIRGLRMTAPVNRAVKKEQNAIHSQASKQTAVVADSASRQFTTSQQHHASRDSSTIDFFYFPDIDHEVNASADMIRVPILPDNYNTSHAPEAETVSH